MLLQYPEAAADPRILTGLLNDYFPTQPMQVNLIDTASALGIAEELRNTALISHPFAYRFVKRLMEEYGISRANADWAVSVWCVCYGRNILKKPCEISLSQPGGGAKPAVLPPKASRSNPQYGDLFTYTVLPEGLGVTGFQGEDKKTLIFSDRHGGLPIKRILPAAFAECAVQQVVMAEGINAIGERAFAGCTELKQAILPFSLRHIGDEAFAGCTSLVTAVLPAALEQIGSFAFQGTALKTAMIPSTVHFLGEGIYADCKRLNHIEIPPHIRSLPAELFKGCESLMDIKLPPALGSIGAGAFAGCTALERLVIPGSVQKIGENAFAGVHPKFMLLCPRLSAAEEYAREHDIRYQIVY